MNSLNALAEDWPPVRFTHDVVRSLWHEIDRFSGQDASRRAFISCGGDTRNEEPFRATIRMASEFYLAYEDSPEMVEPLPLYYGAMWHGKAVALATLSAKDIEDGADMHGMEFKPATGERYPLLQGRLTFKNESATFGLINKAFWWRLQLGRPDIKPRRHP